MRSEQQTSGDRSDKIRTYNYPQQRITDHRTGINFSGIDKMLKGEYLAELVQAYLDKKSQI